MSTGITSIVDQITGRSRIPESARPLAPQADKPKSPPKAPPKRRPREKLLAALDDEWRVTWDLSERANVRTIGFQRPPEPDHAAYERFMAEFHVAFPQATGDEYVRFKHVAAAAAGVLIGYREN